MSIFHSMITTVFSNINFWITSFTNVFLLKSKNLFDLKSICRNYCHKIDISFFLLTHWCYYFTRFIRLFICINSPLSLDVCNKWNLKLWKKLFLSLAGICNKNSNLEDKMKYSPVHLFQKSNPWNIKISTNFNGIYAKY